MERREPLEELPEGITVDLVPEPAGVDSLTRQIRQTGRAYPLFDIGHLILKRPDRYQLDFRASGNLADGSPRQFYVCSLDDSVWMTEGEAVRHVLNRHFDTFYQTERIAVEPPKGTYTFVAQCGMSGVILGPPNLHDYQAKLQRLHSERFSRVPFDVYKSRVRIVRDEAVVKKWIEDQSFRAEFTCLNVPEPLKLASREAVEQHFRQVHLPNIIRPVTSHVVRSSASRDLLPPPLKRLARREFDLQQRFPLKLVTRLSEDFAHRSLHFFKVNKTVLHVAVARPRYLDLETSPVSDGIRRIIETIERHRGCTRRKLLESLGVPLPAEPAPGAEAGSEAPPSAEFQTIVTDLHWLVHEGHVIEFANGQLEVARKPAPRPPPPVRPPPRAEAAAVAPPEVAPGSPAEANTGSAAATTTPVEPPGVEPGADAAPAESSAEPGEAAEPDTTPVGAGSTPGSEGESSPPAAEDPGNDAAETGESRSMESTAESVAPETGVEGSVPEPASPPAGEEVVPDEARVNPS